MDFKIASRKDVYRYSLFPHAEKSIVISATDRFSPPAKIIQAPDYNGIYATKRVKFNDVFAETPYAMKQSDAKKIADFVKKHKSHKFDLIIVNCEMGVSRSAGICAAIMKYYGEDYTKIFRSKNFKPNMHCFNLVCEELDVPASKEELDDLEHLNRNIWKNKTKFENFVFCIHAIKTANVSHVIRHLKIKKAERNIKK